MKSIRSLAVLLAFASLILVSCDGSGGSEKSSGSSTNQARFEEALAVDAWAGEVKVSVNVAASDSDDTGTWSHRIFKVNLFTGYLGRGEAFTLLANGWVMTAGDAASDEDSESTVSFDGGSQRGTVIGSQNIDVKNIVPSSYNALDKVVFLSPVPDSTTFQIYIPEIVLPVTYTSYLDGAQQDQYEASTYLPGAHITGITVNASGELLLSGSRTIRKMISPASGSDVEVDVDVTWSLRPTPAIAPLDPVGAVH